RLFASRIADAVVEGQQLSSKSGEEDEQQAATETAATAAPTSRTVTSAVDSTREIEPGAQSTQVAGVDVSTVSADVQTSVPGNQGFGRTGQQPDSVGDHAQVGTHALVRGATGSPDSEGTQPPQSPEAEKGAETVGAAK
ncbi:MAG: hypothetical protein ACJ74T_23740, partial [Pyrinomonadaceae bacterium]